MKPTIPLLCLYVVAATTSVLGVPPTIDVAWDEPVPPVQNTDYRVKTAPPASADFPDVELITGNLTWQIWSTDSDNPDNIGDIGVISCPHPNNFAVTISNDADPSVDSRSGNHVVCFFRSS